MDGGGGTPRPELLTGAKKSQLGLCLISFQLPMGFQNLIKIHLGSESVSLDAAEDEAIFSLKYMQSEEKLIVYLTNLIMCPRIKLY